MNWETKVKIKDAPSKGPSLSFWLYCRSPILGLESRKSSPLICTTSNWILNFSFSLSSTFFVVLFLIQSLNLYWIETLHVDQRGLKLVVTSSACLPNFTDVCHHARTPPFLLDLLFPQYLHLHFSTVRVTIS